MVEKTRQEWMRNGRYNNQECEIARHAFEALNPSLSRSGHNEEGGVFLRIDWNFNILATK